MRTKNIVRLFLSLAGGLVLAACDSNSSTSTTPPPPPPPPPAMASYDISVSNLTNAQPLSPIAVIAHRTGYSAFSIGAAATTELEEMAEGGDNSSLLAAADGDAAVISTMTGAAPIGPAGSETITLTLLDSDRPGLRISVAGMLVNTNDAFTALDGMLVEMLAVGDIRTIDAVAYDAGTEADSESAATIPGPAGGGEGFNATRDDDADRVSMHSGVISADDGLAGSDLSEQHRFDNPVVRIRIERTS